MTKIVLKCDVPNLGYEGDVKDVADGYARNFLLPKKIAVLYDRSSINELAQKTRRLEKIRDEKRKFAADYLQTIESMTLTISVVSSDGKKIFGAVTPTTIVEQLLKETGILIEKKKVELPLKNIKYLGNYQAKIKLYENKIAILKINVVSQEEKQEDIAEIKVES